jgi:hypothetical protein
MKCILSYRTAIRSAVWRCPVRSHHHYSCVQEWSIEPALHCSRMSACYTGLNGATYPHISLALMATATLVRRVHLGNTLALMVTAALSGACALKTRESCCTTRASGVFLYTWGSRPSESCGLHGNAGALPNREAGSRAVGYMAAPEPSQAWRRGPEPQNTWQRHSPLERRGGVQSHGIHCSVGALPNREAESEATGHMTVSEPS